MIITKEIEIKISSSNFKWYINKGYGPFHNGDKITIKASDLTYGSGYRIDVQCQNCNEIINVTMNNYYYQIKRQNFYVCRKCNFQKVKITNLKKYGSECSLRSELNIERSKKTMMSKYGVDNISKVDYIKEERSFDMKKRSKSMQNAFKEKYDIDNASQLDWVKEKKKQTTLKNWGVENPSQNVELFEKSQKSGKKIKLHEIGLWYRGTYEKDFLDYCLENQIKVKKGLTIKFPYKGKTKYYHSDYFIPKKNLIIEIKSSYYYDKFKELNECKRNETIKMGYNHIFIINKDYIPFLCL